MYSQTSAYLRRRWVRISGDFKLLWKHYFSQSFLATLFVFVVFLILSAENAVVIASIGATAFVVFTMPGLPTAKPRRIIGGHLIGLLIGSLCALIPHATTFASTIVYSISVGISMLLMVILDVEHPPASGTALGITITGFSLPLLLAVLTSSVILSLAHRFLHKYLKDLA